MAKSVTANIFDVRWQSGRTPALHETLEQYATLPLEDRWRGEVRLDKVERRAIGRSTGWYLDFAKQRETGPGALGRGRAIRSIRLEQDEDFGEETAALYIQQRRWLLVLTNGNGIGPNRMMQYFGAVDPGQRHLKYDAAAKIDSGTMEKYEQMGGVRSVEVSASVDALTRADRDAGTSFGRAAERMGAYRVSFTIHANEKRHRDRSLAGGVRDFIAGVLTSRHGVDKVEVTGPDPETQRDMALDLLHHKYRKTYDVEENLVIQGRRYTLDSRWALLSVAYDEWNSEL